MLNGLTWDLGTVTFVAFCWHRGYHKTTWPGWSCLEVFQASRWRRLLGCKLRRVAGDAKHGRRGLLEIDYNYGLELKIAGLSPCWEDIWDVNGKRVVIAKVTVNDAASSPWRCSRRAADAGARNDAKPGIENRCVDYCCRHVTIDPASDPNEAANPAGSVGIRYVLLQVCTLMAGELGPAETAAFALVLGLELLGQQRQRRREEGFMSGFQVYSWFQRS